MAERDIYYLASDGPHVVHGDDDAAARLLRLGYHIITKAEYQEYQERLDRARDWLDQTRTGDHSESQNFYDE